MKNLVIFLCIFAYATATPGFLPGGSVFPRGPAIPGFFAATHGDPGFVGPRPAMFPGVNGGPYGSSPFIGPVTATSPISSGAAVSLGPMVRSGPAIYASGGEIGTGVPGVYSGGADAPAYIQAPSFYSTGSSPGMTYSSGASGLVYSGLPSAAASYSYDRSGSGLYTPAYTGSAISGPVATAPVAYDLSGGARTAALTYAPASTTYGSFVGTNSPGFYTAGPAYSGASALRVGAVEGAGIVGNRAVYATQGTSGVSGVAYPQGFYQPSESALNSASLNTGYITASNPATSGATFGVHRETSAGVLGSTDIQTGGAVVSAQRSGSISGGTLNGV